MKRLLSLVASATIAAGCASGSTQDDAANAPGAAGPNATLRDGNQGAAGGANGAAVPFATCKGIDLANDGVFDVDLKTVHVRGLVTVDGAMPEDTADAGRITFTSTASKGVASVAIARSDHHYEVTLGPGTYDVSYEPDAKACESWPTPSAWPCNGHLLKPGVLLTADGALDLDLATVVVRGAVTLTGHPWPASVAAAVTFAEIGRGPAVVPFDQDGYVARLFKGTSVVGYAPQSSACGTKAPCNGGILMQNVDLRTAGALDIDVPMVVTRGAVSLNGTRMTGDTYGGSLTFSTGAKPELGAASPATIPIASDGSYALALLPDRYSVAYSGVPYEDPLLPRGGGRLRSDVVIRNDGNLDVDVPTATVSGKVTLDGGAVSRSDAGAITFASSGAAAASAPIRADGSYTTIVVPGTYDVGYGPSNGCPASGVMPCNSGKLQTFDVVAGTSALDVDLKVVKVTGKLTLNGAPPKSATTATVTFAAPGATQAPPDAPAAGTSVGVDANASYFVRLLAGTYDVNYGGARCTRDDMSMPCNAGLLRPAQSFASSGELDLDVGSARIRGKVTVGGKPVTDASADRGDLAFTSKSSSSRATQPVDPIGPANYEAHLLRGRYVMTYAPTDGSCIDGAKSLLPCAELVVAGCD
jgi:hypothetical protein